MGTLFCSFSLGLLIRIPVNTALVINIVDRFAIARSMVENYQGGLLTLVVRCKLGAPLSKTASSQVEVGVPSRVKKSSSPHGR